MIAQDSHTLVLHLTNGKELGRGDSVSYVGLPAGNYYVKVTGSASTAGQTYNLVVLYNENSLYETERNDTAALANPVALNKSYEGMLQYDKDIDYYQLVVPVKAVINMQLTIPAAKYAFKMEIRLSTGAQIESNLLKPFILLPGTYYVRIIGTVYASKIPYKLQISAARAPLVAAQVKVTNAKGAHDLITVSNLNNGDIIKVYSSANKLIATSLPVSDNKRSADLVINQLGVSSGAVYITVSSAGLSESIKTKVGFAKE